MLSDNLNRWLVETFDKELMEEFVGMINSMVKMRVKHSAIYASTGKDVDVDKWLDAYCTDETKFEFIRLWVYIEQLEPAIVQELCYSEKVSIEILRIIFALWRGWLMCKSSYNSENSIDQSTETVGAC